MEWFLSQPYFDVDGCSEAECRWTFRLCHGIEMVIGYYNEGPDP